MSAAQRSATTEGTRPPVAADRRVPARRRLGIRLATVALAASVLVAGAGVTASGAVTSAAWTDHTSASATITSGTWSALGSCTALNSAGAAVGTCAISSMIYDATGGTGKHLRTYDVTFSVSSTAAASVVFQANLSAATVRVDTSVGAWNWPTAVTLPATQMTPTSPCTALPSLTGRATSANWMLQPTIAFQLADARSAFQGLPSCS